MKISDLSRVALACLPLSFVVGGLGACVEDPEYIAPKQSLEVGVDPTMMDAPATATLTLPFKLETAKDAMTRAALATKLGVDVPYIKVGDIDVSVEWTIKNLSADPGTATIKIDGANPYFAYVAVNFVVDPREDPTPPSLMGGIPMTIPGNGVVDGVIREDQVLEASIDLDQITRGSINPFRALLTPSKDLTEFQPVQLIDPTMPDLGTMPVGLPIPRAAFAELTRFDVAFTADKHMVMEYAIRVRDHRGVLHKDLLDAPAGELTTFDPAIFTPPPPPAP